MVGSRNWSQNRASTKTSLGKPRCLGLDVVQMVIEEMVTDLLAGASMGTAAGVAAGAISKNTWGAGRSR